MTMRRRLFIVLFLTGLAACDPNIHIGGVAGDAGAASHVPGQLPARMLIGLEDNDGTWMKDSGVAWDVRWAYFTGNASSGIGWYNNWTGGALSTAWATSWLADVAGQGFIPGVHYYLLDMGYAPSNSAQLLAAKLQSRSVMADYFGKFKLFLQAAQSVPSPILVVLEGRTLGMIEEQANNDASTYAAIADSGLAELSGLPNTVAGFGLAFLALRNSMAATNVLLGPDVEQSAAGSDFLNHGASDDVAPHVDYQYGFLGHLGVAPNVTGTRYDFVAACPAYADADKFTAQGDSGMWWDASEGASLQVPSFNRYLHWLTLFNQAAKVPWVLWQIPMGNANSPNVPNQGGAWAGPYGSGCVVPAGCVAGATAGCPGGYKDNRAEYLLGPSSEQHLARFAAAGTIALLFGPDAGCTDQTSDYYSDGQAFMKSRAGALLGRGGFPLSR